jgi:hypothetical protein
MVRLGDELDPQITVLQMRGSKSRAIGNRSQPKSLAQAKAQNGNQAHL